MKHLAALATICLGVHGVLFLHGVRHPESLMAGDRARGRLAKIETVFASGHQNDRSVSERGSVILRRMLELGDPGDYLLQGAILTKWGRGALVLVQLLLLFVSVIWVYWLGRILHLSRNAALAGALLYMSFPGTLVQAHQLGTEAWFSPLVIVGLTWVVYYAETNARLGTLAWGSFVLALAILVRPQLILFPFILTGTLWILGPAERRFHALSIVPICLSIPIAWAALVHSRTGEYTLGGKGSSLGLNFTLAVERMAVMGGFAYEPPHPGYEMPVTEFVAYAASYPGTFARLKGSELANVVANPGTYAVAAHHFRIVPGAGDTSAWRRIRDENGLGATVAEMVRRGPLVLFVIIGGVVCWGAVLSLALVGGVSFVRRNGAAKASKAIVLLYLLYGWLVVLSSGAVRWSHRAPVEFVIALLAAIALPIVLRRYRTAVGDGA